jgi:hypothetical protein
MVFSRQEAVRRANAARTNKVGMCQQWTRDILGAPSAGDRDGDRDADAIDGWQSEPASKRHTDRNPPAGVPVAFDKKFGHRAVSLGGGKIRSTDMSTKTGRYSPGEVGTVTIEQIENSMGVRYLGWSETITGIPIPDDTKKPAPVKKTSRGARVDRAIKSAKLVRRDLTKSAKGAKGGVRAKQLELAIKHNDAQIAALEKVPFIK